MRNLTQFPLFLTEIGVIGIIVTTGDGLIPLIAGAYNIRILAASI